MVDKCHQQNKKIATARVNATFEKQKHLYKPGQMRAIDGNGLKEYEKFSVGRPYNFRIETDEPF